MMFSKLKNYKKLSIVLLFLLLLVSLGTAVYFKFGYKIESNEFITKEVSLSCEFGNDTGSVTKSFVKNGVVRISTSSGSGQAGEFLLMDNKMYVWEVSTMKGYIYDVLADNNQINQADIYLSMINEYKELCKPADLDDSYFIPPPDVEFQEIPQTPQQ